MNWKKVTTTAVLALVVVFCMTGCPKKPPATPGAPMGPDSTWTYATTVFKVWTTAGGNIRYVMNWTDKTDTSDLSYASGETASVTHVWNAVGTYDVKAMAILDADPAKASEFSPAKSVKVILNNRPVVDSVQRPPVGVKGGETFITVNGSDVDGDSLRVIVNWGGSKDTTTELFPTPCYSTVSHVFTSLGDATVIIWTQDWKGAKSLPDTIVIPIGTSGGVKWYWWSSDPENGETPLTTSALVANDGTDEVVLGSCEDDYNFYSISASSGHSKHKVTTKELEGVFTGHPGLNVANHIIVGSDEGEIYALALLNNLHVDWQYPDSAKERGTYTEWGAPAFNGYNFYIGHDDDSIFEFADNGVAGGRIAAYGLHASVVDAPIIDATGNVIFGTTGGCLYKMTSTLNSVVWCDTLMDSSEVYGPILGAEGTIYCATDGSHLYAIDPADGSVKSGWPLTLDGNAIRPALGLVNGQPTLFVGSDFGTVYSINPATGTINWEKPLAQSGSFGTAPVVAANGYVYFQNDDDMLYCVNQADGTLIWSCNCPNYLPRTGGGSPHRPRKLQLTGYDPNPSITSTGDIIVVGSDACYCVAGYPEGPLDPTAAWPKWQKNLSNSGK